MAKRIHRTNRRSNLRRRNTNRKVRRNTNRKVRRNTNRKVRRNTNRKARRNTMRRKNSRRNFRWMLGGQGAADTGIVKYVFGNKAGTPVEMTLGQPAQFTLPEEWEEPPATDPYGEEFSVAEQLRRQTRLSSARHYLSRQVAKFESKLSAKEKSWKPDEVLDIIGFIILVNTSLGYKKYMEYLFEEIREFTNGDPDDSIPLGWPKPETPNTGSIGGAGGTSFENKVRQVMERIRLTIVLPTLPDSLQHIETTPLFRYLNNMGIKPYAAHALPPPPSLVPPTRGAMGFNVHQASSRSVRPPLVATV
jgi:hypothetical protein